MFTGKLGIRASHFNAGVADVERLSWDLAPFHRPDNEGLWRHPSGFLFEQTDAKMIGISRSSIPWVCNQTGIAVAFWGRIDNRVGLADSLRAISDSNCPLPTDSQLILAAWHKWGDRLTEHLEGDFALAVIDAQLGTVFLARDPLGVKPLFYHLDGDGLAFASTVPALKRVLNKTMAPDVDWIARYVLHLSMSHQDTAYQDLRKLPPGHSLIFVVGQGLQLRRWHHWRDDAPPAISRNSRWVDDYREILEESIRCRMGSAYLLGTENSGGIDSATITAYLARMLGGPGERLHSFGFALAEQEPAYILETSQAARIKHNYLITSGPDLTYQEAVLDRSLKVLGYPEEHSNASGHSPFYQECEVRGIRSLFSGFGGDEVVTNPGRHLRLELVDAKNIAGLWDISRGNPLTRGLRVGKALLQRHQPSHNAAFFAAWTARWPHQLLRQEVVERLDLRRQYFATSVYDAPYRRINDFILQHLLPQPYISTRLESCTLMAASYGVTYQWPLWDARLVQQYLSTPSIEKMGPKSMGRYLHRRAIDGVVPHKVAWKPSKDMGNRIDSQLLSGERLMDSADRARAVEASLHPLLDALVDRPKLRQQIAQASTGHGPQGFDFSFHRSVSALVRVNHWLHTDFGT